MNESNSIFTLLNQVEQNRIRFIDLQFTDIVGMVKNVTIPAQDLKDALEKGAQFDGSGRRCMSLSAIRAKPSMDEPSN
jgi:glutamine synthetase